MPVATSSRPRPARLGSRHQPEVTRAAILTAALDEFALAGIAGARTAAIARAAGVNPALIYYYFGSKEALYHAVLEDAFAQLSQQLLHVLNRPLSPRDRLLAYAAAHFDYLATHPRLPRLLHREMLRSYAPDESLSGDSLNAVPIGGNSLRRSSLPASSAIPGFFEKYSRPNFLRLTALIAEGTASGDFRPVNPAHTVLSVVAMIAFYFMQVDILNQIMPGDPLSTARLQERRSSVLDLISAAVFATPAPEPCCFKQLRLQSKLKSRFKSKTQSKSPSQAKSQSESKSAPPQHSKGVSS